jgi:hypothetical protein
MMSGLAPRRWLKAILRLRHFPGILLSFASGALVLAVASSSGTFFLSSAGNAALEEELGRLTPQDAGVTASIYGRVKQGLFERPSRVLAAEVANIPHLDPPVVTAISNILTARSPSTEARVQVHLLFRTAATAHIEKLQEAGGSGVWVPDNVAEALEMEAGDRFPLLLGDRRVRPRVAGVYRNLPSQPVSDFWRPLTFELINPEPMQPQPPPPLIADEAVFFQLGRALATSAEYRLQFPFSNERITLAQAQRLRAEYEALSDRATDPKTALRETFDRLSVQLETPVEIGTLLPSSVGQIEETVATLDVSVRLISLSGQAVALVAIAAAAMFGVRRRTTEMRLLVAQGVGPIQQGARASAEAIVPVALGAVVGWVVASQLVQRLGPSDLITPGVAAVALKVALGSGALALLAIGIVVAAAARRQVASPGTVGGRVKRLPWELALLLLAGASLYETFSGRSALIEATGEPPQADIFVLAFPILFIAGMAGLAVRGLRRILPKLHGGGSRAPAPLYLASRRLTGTSSLALLLVAIAALAIGVLVYAGALISSTEATVDAKALVATGSDVAISIAPSDRIPKSGWPTTKVGREGGDLLPGDVAVEVLEVDPSTFAEVAFWDDRFSDVPLDELLTRLADPRRQRLPVIAAGTSIAGDTTLEIGGDEVPVTIVASASAFPGMPPHTPLVVADARRLQRKVGVERKGIDAALPSPELWIKGDGEEILRVLHRNGLGYGLVRTPDEVKQLTELKAISWTYGLMQAFGLMAGVLALVAMLSYLVARQRERMASYGLARRMGLGRTTHRVAVVLELGGMLLTSALLGAGLAVVAARLIVRQVDPLPELAPAPLLDLPAPVLVSLVPAVLVASVFGAWQVQRSADHADMAEVMRLGG